MRYMAAKRLAPRSSDLHDVEQARDAHRLSFEGLIGRRLLGFLHQLGDALGFLVRIVLIKRLAVLFHAALDHMAVNNKIFVLECLGFGDIAVPIKILHRLH